MKTPIGDATMLYVYTTTALAEGDVLQTPTGRSYRIFDASRRPGGDRVACHVVVIDPASIEPSDVVIPITWRSR